MLKMTRLPAPRAIAEDLHKNMKTYCSNGSAPETPKAVIAAKPAADDEWAWAMDGKKGTAAARFASPPLGPRVYLFAAISLVVCAADSRCLVISVDSKPSTPSSPAGDGTSIFVEFRFISV